MSRRPNIVLAVADSMRARNVSSYGYERQTTPNIDGLAKQGIRFKNAFVQAPFTIASSASILTGTYPVVHRLERYGQRLNDSLVTLPEILQRAGYLTAGFVSNPHLSQESGLRRGFEFFTDGRPWFKKLRLVNPLVAWAESGRSINRHVRQMIRQSKYEDRPFFYFVFYNDSHTPFSALPRVLLPFTKSKIHTPDFETQQFDDEELAQVKDAYDRAQMRADAAVGQLRRLISDADLEDYTTFLFTADHGEGLDRRIERAGHGRLYESGIHVPFIVVSPGLTQGGQINDDLVSTLDIAPTICQIAGVDPPAQFQGQSLLPLLDGRSSEPLRDAVVSEYHDCRSIRTTRWKLILRGAGISDSPEGQETSQELYDLDADPWEENNLAADYPEIVQNLATQLRDTLRSSAAQSESPQDFELDDAVVERLKGLGYIE